MGETKALVHECMKINFHSLPESTVDRVKYHLLDYVGVAARGSISDSSKFVHEFLSDFNHTGDGAVIIGTQMKALPGYAAIANGAASHSLELDDVANEASLHPAVVIMSSAFDAAHLARASGKQIIEAIVAGYEVMIRLGVCLDPAAHYQQGFHPTGTCGTFGAAMTAGRLFGLNEEQMVNALGIAGSQAAGSMEFLTNGAYTKRLHPGWAAHAGIVAALLAKKGFTGPDTIIEGARGFLKAYSPNSDVSKLLVGWAQPYKIERTSIKPHACCRYIQGPLDCILQIVQEHQLKPDDIEKVTIAMLETGIPIVAEPKDLKYNPKSVVDAQFSMPFGAAVAILYGKASLDEYTEHNLKQPQVLEMMQRVHIVTDKELEREFPKKWPAKAWIHTKSGNIYHAEVEYPKGDPENPLTWDEMISKFNNLTSSIFSEQRRQQIIDRIRTLEKEEYFPKFAEILAV